MTKVIPAPFAFSGQFISHLDWCTISNMRKVRVFWRPGLLVAFLLLALTPFFSSLTHPFAQTPARANSNIDQLCVLPTSAVSGGRTFTGGQVFTISIIDRAHMQITYNGGSGKCISPPDLTLTQLAPNYKWTQFFNSNFIVADGDTSDTYGYAHCVGSKCNDDTQLAYFNGGAVNTKDVLGGHDAVVSNSAVQNFLSPAEFLIDIESSSLAGSGVGCDQGANAEFGRQGGASLHWFCNGQDATDPGNGDGRIHGPLIRNIVDPATLGNFNITYTYSGTSVQSVSKAAQSSRTFTWCTGLSPNQYRNENCNGDLVLHVGSGPQAGGLLQPAYLQGLGASTGNMVIESVSNPGNFQTVQVAGASSLATTQGGSTNSTTSGNPPTPNCEIPGGFGWLLCPIISASNDFFGVIKGQVASLLQFPALTTGPTGHFDGAFKVWGALRNLSDAFFVIIFLIIIFSNTLSIGLNNYDIKKMLPRLVAAAVLVQFSWVIMQLAVDVTNILGVGIGSLVGAVVPAASGGPSATVGYVSGAITGITAGLVGGAALALGFLIPILLAIFGLVLTIIGVLITLELRKLVLIVLIVASPLAFMAWVLPNTESTFKTWLKLLTRLLLMYPIIVFIFALAAVAQSVTTNASSGQLEQILTAILPTLVFFTVPWTFKWAGGAMNAIGGAVTARTTGYTKAAKGSQFAKNAAEDRKRKLAITESKGGVRGYTAGVLGGGRVLGRLGSGNKFRSNITQSAGYDNTRKRIESDASITDGDLINFANGDMSKVSSGSILKSMSGDTGAIGAVHRMIAEKGLYSDETAGALEKSSLTEQQKDFVYNYTRSGAGGQKMAEGNMVLAMANRGALQLNRATGKVELDRTKLSASALKGISGRAGALTAKGLSQEKSHGIAMLEALGNKGIGQITPGAITGQKAQGVASDTSDATRAAIYEAINRSGNVETKAVLAGTIKSDGTLV